MSALVKERDGGSSRSRIPQGRKIWRSEFEVERLQRLVRLLVRVQVRSRVRRIVDEFDERCPEGFELEPADRIGDPFALVLLLDPGCFSLCLDGKLREARDGRRPAHRD